MSEVKEQEQADWSVGALKPKNIDNLPEAMLSQLAKDIAMGKVFTTDHMPEYDQRNLIHLVFMPIAFGAYADLSDEAKKDIGFIYEYLDKAGPRSINGYPMFFSCACVSIHDRKIIWEKVEKIGKLLESV